MKQEAATGPFNKRRVLVIDDHFSSRTFLMNALNEIRFEVAGVGTDGKGAARLAKSAAPDVVLMAVGLPDIDGVSASEKIMEECPVPIVLLTSHHDPQTIERAKAAGVMALLLKPLRKEELVPVIELAISRFEEFASLRKENEDLKKTIEARKTIERAKGMLMTNRGLSESEAFSLIQKKSMDLRKPMVEIAQAIILAEEINREKEA